MPEVTNNDNYQPNAALMRSRLGWRLRRLSLDGLMER